MYLRELEERRTAILASIEEQGKLTDALRATVEAAETKQTLEDVYLPYKPKRRTGRRVRARPAWNRWLMRCSPPPRSIRSRKRPSM